MQIITLDNQEFPAVEQELFQGKLIGKYFRGGQMLLVRVNPHYVFIADGEQPTRIAFKPASCLIDAQSMALEYLQRELRRGNAIELEEEFQRAR